MNPVPLQRTKPVVPREPPPRLALLPKPANRQDRQPEADAGKVDDMRQKPDSSANGESAVYVSRVPSFQGRRPSTKGTSAMREGMMIRLFVYLLLRKRHFSRFHRIC